MRCKGADLIVANDVGKDGVMGKDETTVTLITAAGAETWADLSKDEVARRLISLLADQLAGRSS